MSADLRLAALADFDPEFPPHAKTTEAVLHVERRLGVAIGMDWVSSADLRRVGPERLSGYDAYWIAPGRFDDLEAGLAGVQFARESGRPVLGTCGGCQSMVLEFARDVVGLERPRHEAYDGAGDPLVVHRLACSLRGRRMELVLDERQSKLTAAYGATRAEEEYYCEFGVNPAYEALLSEHGLGVAARDGNGEARIFVLGGHPFYVATVFVPQLRSTPERPHPLVGAFVRAAGAVRRGER